MQQGHPSEFTTIQDDILAWRANEGSLSLSLFEWVKEIATTASAGNAVQRRNRFLNEGSEITDLAFDFLMDLRLGKVTGIILSRADLSREFRRWHVKKHEPQKKELWEILSENLRKLEDEGKVKRGAAFRGRSNSNACLWYLTGCEGSRAIDLKPEQVSAFLPKKRKTGKKDRVLKPAEAESCLMGILNMARGEIRMGTLFELIRKNLCLFEVYDSLDQPVGEDGEATLGELLQREEEISTDELCMIQEQAAHAAKLIQDRTGPIIRKRGAREVSGHTVLCRYYLPKKLHQEQVKLQDLGPPSAVSEAVQDIDLIVESLFKPMLKGVRERHICLEILKNTFEILWEFCSEIGCRIGFHSDRHSEKDQI